MVRLRIVLLMTITASALQFTPVYVLARQDPTVSFNDVFPILKKLPDLPSAG